MTGRAYERELLVELGNIAHELKMTRMNHDDMFNHIIEIMQSMDGSLEHFVACTEDST